MTYSKLGNIKGPQGRRGLNMTGGATPPPAVDDSVLEGDIWLDSVTGDVYRATDPWAKDGSWHTWGTVLWKVADNILMVQPAEGDMGTFGEPVGFGPYSGAPWCNSSINPSMASITSVRSKGTIAMNENNGPLFYYWSSLTDISAVSEWNISNATNMGHMFEYCSAFTEIPSAISGWDISGVTDMRYMFYNCTSLTDISALSGWDTSGVTNMRNVFSNCTSLTDLSPLSGWDVSGVTNMTVMFSGCTSLTDISAISGWNVSSVTSMDNMFHNCSSLTDISALSGWDTSGVTNMYGMFDTCTSLTDASILSGWNMSSVTDMRGMFQNCPLKRIGVPSLARGGKKFVSNFKNSYVVTNMNTTMLTNTTTHETMSANQILTDMDSNPSKYAAGTVWTL